MTPRLRSTSAILVAFVVSFGVYVASVRGDVSFWDTADLQTVPYILGIPYPTGYPGFVLVGWAWTHLIPFGSVAWRMNLLTALASAGTVAALTALLLEIGTGAAIALAGAAIYAFAGLPWNHATYVDVHPVSCVAVACALLFAVRWRRDGNERDAALTLGAVTAALALDNTTVLALPGLALIAFGRRPPAGVAVRAGAAAAAVLALVYAYLPLRSAWVTARSLDPTRALGIPPGRPFWDDGHPSSLAGFGRVVFGLHFEPVRGAIGLLGPTAIGRVATDFFPLAVRDLGEPLLWLALFGAVLWAWREPLPAAGLFVLGAVPLLFAFAYPAESDTSRYELAAYLVLVVFAASAAAACASLPRAPRAAAALTGAVLAVALVIADVGRNASLFGQPREPGASLFIGRIRLLTPSDAVIVAPWVYATALGYGAYVEHSLGSRIVVTADPHEYEGSYRVWLRDRPVVVISDDDQRFVGLTARPLDGGSPHLYALR